jgi:uncharacterized protein YjeT (DUF2065 family)
LDSNILWLAFGLALIFEGLFPFLSPSGWRRVATQIQQMNDGQVRFFGLCSIAIGFMLVMLLL